MFEYVQIVVVSLVSIANIILLVWQTRKRMPGELTKMQAEERESISEAAESIVAGAKDSNDLLLERIRELKKEKRDLWNYVAILKKQLIEANIQPERYTPTESDPNIPKIK